MCYISWYARAIPYDSWKFSYDIVVLYPWRYTWPRTRRDAQHATIDHARTHACTRDALAATQRKGCYLLHTCEHVRRHHPACYYCTFCTTRREERYVRVNKLRSRSTTSTNWQREWKKGVIRSELREQLYDIHKNDVMEYFVSRFTRWQWCNPQV